MTTSVHTYTDNEYYTGKLESAAPVGGGPEEVFLHLEVHDFNKTCLKLVQTDLTDLMMKAYEKGLTCLSFYVKKEVGTKFHNMVKPLDYEVDHPTHPDYVIGGWFVDEVYDGY